MDEVTKERYEARIRTLERALEESEKEVKEYKASADHYLYQWNAARRAGANDAQEVKRLREAAKTEFVKLNGFNSRLMQENAQLKREINGVKNQGAALTVERNALRDTNRELAAKLNVYVAEHGALKAVLGEREEGAI